MQWMISGRCGIIQLWRSGIGAPRRLPPLPPPPPLPPYPPPPPPPPPPPALPPPLVSDAQVDTVRSLGFATSPLGFVHWRMAGHADTCNTMVLCPLRLSLIVGAVRFMTVLANCGSHLVFDRPCSLRGLTVLIVGGGGGGLVDTPSDCH